MKTCCFHRWLAPLWAWPSDRPGWARRHLESCSACRQALERDRRIEATLRWQAPGVTNALPPRVRPGILGAVARPVREPRVAVSRLALAAAGAVAVAGFVAFLPQAPVSDSGGIPVRSAPGPAPLYAAWLDPLERVERWPTWLDQPLRAEAERTAYEGGQLVAGLLRSVLPAQAADLVAARAGLLADPAQAVD